MPPLIAFALLTGLSAALAGRQELRMSPRPILLTRGFLSYLSYACLVLVPVSVYFYVFHGDWFLLYTVDVSQIPSAMALLGFVAEAALGALSFVLGAILVRNQREMLVGILAGAGALAGSITVFLNVERLGQVGDHAQFEGQFGLEAFEDGPLLTGALVMGGILLIGFVFLLVRLWMSGRTR